MRFARRSRSSSTPSPFVTQDELRERLTEEAAALSGALLLTKTQSGFLDWLERQVDALQAKRVDAEILQAVIQRWQKLRSEATQFDTGAADLIAVDY